MKNLILLLAFAASVLTAHAQGGGIFGGGGNSSTQNGGSSGSYYNMGADAGLTIPVNLWGFVRNPGRYIVPSSTTLVQLISFGGGPVENARLTDLRIVRDVRVDSTIVEKILVMNLDLFQRTGDPSQNPILYPGDTVVVPGNALSTFQIALGIARDVAIVLSTVLSIIYLTRPR